jgi:pimeloyl-ACP methyl ester carboxylesterase
MKILVALSVITTASACVNVPIDDNETGTAPVPSATVEFSPSDSIVPFPNNLVRSPTTGKVAVPASCNETPAQTAVRSALNQLDGFGTFKPVLQFTTTTAVDPTTLQSSIVLLRRASGTTTADPAFATPIPFVAVPNMTARSSADCSSTKAVDSVAIVPLVPLQQSSTYVVVVKNSLKTAAGVAYSPSVTWAFVRQPANPVTVSGGKVVAERTPFDANVATDVPKLLGIDLLWKAHAPALNFAENALRLTPEEIVLSWEFSTQTTTAAVDPGNSNSVASSLPSTPLLGNSSVTGGDTQAFMNGALSASTCAQLGCAAVGDVLGSLLVAPNYQQPSPNPLTGGLTIPATWTDPTKPTQMGNNMIQVLVFVPAAPAPTAGYPTIIFGHGLGQDKSNLFAVASQLARAGFASVAIDFVAHGSRAVQNSKDAALGCNTAPAPSPKSAPQCYAPFLSANLAGTRDNIRQTVLDMLRLGNALRGCGTASCGALKVDANRIGYAGLSLGGILGSMVSSMSKDIKVAALSVPGAGLVDVLENTNSLAIKCSLVNSLIDAGVVAGDKFNPGTGTGLCTTDAWKAQPGYKVFANVARWILDSADPANFASTLATHKFLIQKVVNDAVVPNVTTDALGKLSGLGSEAASVATAFSPPASKAITDAISKSHWITYTDVPAAAGFPGNKFQHASLLAPAGAGTDGILGMLQVQVDAITFLAANL